MIKKLFLILIVLGFLSCGNKTNETIYKTKDGEYASKHGNFIADFPTKPNYSAIDNALFKEAPATQGLLNHMY